MARTRLEARLTLMIDDVDRRAKLTEAQKKKLHAAGELDVRRFFERIEQIKNGYVNGLEDRTKRLATLSERGRLIRDFDAGLFGPGSFLDKVEGTMLGEERIAKVRESRRNRDESRWKTRARIMAQTWGDAVGLDADQRRKFSELIIAEVPPFPRVGPLDYQFIMFRLSRVPRDKLRPIFDDAQWKVFGRILDQNSDDRSKDEFTHLGYDLGEAGETKPKPEPAK